MTYTEQPGGIITDSTGRIIGYLNLDGLTVTEAYAYMAAFLEGLRMLTAVKQQARELADAQNCADLFRSMGIKVN